MRTEKEVIDRLEQFKKDNPKDWVYRTDNPALQALYQTTIEQLEWVLSEKD